MGDPRVAACPRTRLSRDGPLIGRPELAIRVVVRGDGLSSREAELSNGVLFESFSVAVVKYPRNNSRLLARALNSWGLGLEIRP